MSIVYPDIGTNDGFPYLDSRIDDFVFYTQNNTQSILFGNAASNNSALAISYSNNSNILLINGILNVNNSTISGNVTYANTISSSNFVGMIAYFASSNAPSGWLACDGSMVSRTTYASLFNIIGISWAISGQFYPANDTFPLPDLRGEFFRGWDRSRGIDTGRNLISIQNASMVDHSHSGTTDVSSFPHTHNSDWKEFYGGDIVNDDGSFQYCATPYSTQISTTTSSSTDTSHTHTYVTGNPNTGGGTETRPRNVALLACIKY